MTESTERPLYTILGLIIAGGLLWIILSLVFTQGALGAITESKQSQELQKLLGAIKSVCGDSNHPETTVTVTVFGQHQIIYHKVPADFGSKKKKSVEDAGCEKNCLCAFNGDKAVQCISMFSQKETGCQDINIQEDHLIDTDLSFPDKTILGLPSNICMLSPVLCTGSLLPIPKLPDNTCQFQLKLKWYGGSDNVVLVESNSVQTLSYTQTQGADYEVICVFEYLP